MTPTGTPPITELGRVCAARAADNGPPPTSAAGTVAIASLPNSRRVTPMHEPPYVSRGTAILPCRRIAHPPVGGTMPRMRSLATLLLLPLVVAAGCSGTSDPTASGGSAHVPIADLPAIEAERILAHTRTLSSDAFRGRAPGTEGEDLTLAYLEQQFKQLGLQPGNTDGAYVQQVRLLGLTPSEAQPLTVRGEGRQRTFGWRDEVVAWTHHVADGASISDSEVVFVGYGVTAPEFDWDDFKDLDVRGKTLIVLINDPQVPDPDDASALDDDTFGGRAMTYYGRWTYKFEEAARRGAAGVFIVHDTEPAGYPFSVVQGNLGERLDLETEDGNMDRAD